MHYKKPLNPYSINSPNFFKTNRRNELKHRAPPSNYLSQAPITYTSTLPLDIVHQCHYPNLRLHLSADKFLNPAYKHKHRVEFPGDPRAAKVKSRSWCTVRKAHTNVYITRSLWSFIAARAAKITFQPRRKFHFHPFRYISTIAR